MSKLKPTENAFIMSFSAQDMLDELAKMLAEPSRLYCDLEWTRDGTKLETESRGKSWRENVDLFYMFIKHTKADMKIQSMCIVVPSFGVIELYAVPNRCVSMFEAWIKTTLVFNPLDKDLVAAPSVFDPYTACQRNSDIRKYMCEMADHVWWILGNDLRISEQSPVFQSHFQSIKSNTWADVKDKIL